jgi:hypothetical protein
MPIKEIDPNDPLFRNLKMEGATVKVAGSKFAIPSFMQKRDATLITPKVKPIPVPIPVPVVTPELIPEPIVEPIPEPEPVKQVRSVDTLPQVKVKVKQSWDLPMPTDIRRRPVPPSPIPEPVPVPQPVPAREAMPEYIWPKKPEPVVTAPVSECQQLDSADIYGTRKKPSGSGFKLPSFFQRKEKLIVPIDYKAQETITRPKFSIDWKKMSRLIVQIGVGVLFVYIGLTSTGSYYEPASRVSGDLATVFYVFQLGTLLTTIGCILGYDAIRRAGKL